MRILMKSFTAGLFGLLFVPFVLAQQPAQNQGVKKSATIAVIDLNQVVARSIMGQRFQKEIEQLRMKQREELQRLQNELAQLQKRFEEQASVLSAEALIDLRAKARQKSREIERFREDADAEVLERRQAFLERLEQELRPVIGQYCQEKGIDLVLDTQFVIFAQRAIDITNDIIQRFNARIQQAQSGNNR